MRLFWYCAGSATAKFPMPISGARCARGAFLR